MKIKINGQETETAAANIAELAANLHLPEQGVAIALNQQMIPRSLWVETPLAESAQVVIIKAACGG